MAFSVVNLPAYLADLPIERLNLSIRSFNALRRNGIATVGQLLLLSSQDLLRFDAFGKKSLIDVQRALNQLLEDNRKGHGPGELPANLDLPRKRAVRLNVSPGGWLCPQDVSVDLDVPVGVLDLSARPRHVLHHLGIKSVRQLLNLSKDDFREFKNIGRTSVVEVQLNLSSYLSGAPSTVITGTHPSGEAASFGTKRLADSMLGRLPERARNVLCDRYGLWDGIAETLQDIGDKLGVTRERIRQIEEKSLSRLQHIFGRRWLSELVARKLKEFLIHNPSSCDALDEDEAISAMADDCSAEEAALALSLLNDIASGPGQRSILTCSLIEAEAGIYCLNKKVAADYRALLETTKSALEKHQKPISEVKLRREMTVQMPEDTQPDTLRLADRIFSISPSIARLRGGQIALSLWTEFQRRDASALAEAALRLIGKTAHFRDIAAKVNELAEVPGGVNERTVHNAILRTPDKFVWVSSGTYGLAAWGIKRPPYLKDRLLQLLAETSYPLPYWHLRERVLEVCNCREASIRMTLDLNSKLFKKFEGDQYGLQKHHGDLRN